MNVGQVKTRGQVRYDPRDPAIIQNPLPALLALQRTEPLYWCKELRGWLVTRHEDIRSLQLDHRVSADRLSPYLAGQAAEAREKVADLVRYLNTWVAFKDPPDHSRLRQGMNRVLTHKVIASLHDSIDEIIKDRLDSIDAQGLDEFDFISEFANPLPASVIMDLLGVPRSDMEMLRDWSGMIQPFIGNATSSEDKYTLGRDGITALADYFRDVIRDRELRPGQDVISHFVSVRAEGLLSEDELVGMCMLFLFAGHETTTNLIGNGLRALIAHPEQEAMLRADRGLIAGAVEEMLRFDGPTGALVRVLKEDMELYGQTMRTGDRLYLMVNAANHDPSRFDAPERFDITRNPNPHLAFNVGAHFCLGAPLARAEAAKAINGVLDRYAAIRLLREPEYMDTLVMRGVREMPVAIIRK